MKPTDGKVLELSIPSDFSQCAMNDAMDLIWEEVAPRGYHVGRDHYYLEIGVEGGLLKAIDVCRAWDIGFGLNLKFEPDEWLLTCTHFDANEVSTVHVWCPGA